MRRSQGFTLIEVMITVAIVAILAAIALPSYSDYVRRGRLTEALSALSNMRVKMEQYFQDNRSYVAVPAACGAPGTSVAPLPPNSNNFVFACVPVAAAGVNPSSYTITATGAGTMLGFIYTLTDQNVQTTTGVPPGWLGVGNNCWVTKKDGSC